MSSFFLFLTSPIWIPMVLFGMLGAIFGLWISGVVLFHLYQRGWK